MSDELPSERFDNAALLKKALNDIREGDILLAHIGIWSRKDVWAPAVIEWMQDQFAVAQQWLFEAVVQPLAFGLGGSGPRMEDYGLRIGNSTA